MATIKAQDLRRMIRRFRVLIMGRANAGKMTILQKVCNTADQPEIYDPNGKKVRVMICGIHPLTDAQCGNHDITNEMMFKSTPGFVFHDSCGFEAGSEEDFENMKKFISEHAHATELEERIHTIWYCIPMDDLSRTFQRSEEKFFQECDTGHVPVVAVFTKFEALRPFTYGEIKKQLQGVSDEERSKRIAERVEELFTKTGVLGRLCVPENLVHPNSYVRLQNMNKQNTNCDTLLESTTFALDDGELQSCLVSTQKSNLELCIKCAIATLVDCALRERLIQSDDSL
ncbi:hypothetical protein BDR06DRAFT_938403, partial [Suillus hirtellus]